MPLALLLVAGLVACSNESPDKVAAPVDVPQQVDELKKSFASPPNEARPRVWWHWMNGNVTEQGIARDLEWMHRIGIGGVQNFDAAMATPVIVEQRLPYMSPQWKKAFRFAVQKADELDLEFAIASSAGWSLTGGPWVPPEDAMKKLVWSETVISGGAAFDGALPEPPGTVGPYQTAQAVYQHAHNEHAIPNSFYRDALVLAYPLQNVSPQPVPRTVTVNDRPVDMPTLVDGRMDTAIELPRGSDSATMIVLDYGEPQTVQAAALHITNPPPSFLGGPWRPTLEALVSDDTWQRVAEFPLKAVPTTLSFAPVTASRFRLVVSRAVQESSFDQQTSSSQDSSSHFAPSAGVDPAGLGDMAAMASAGAASMLTDLRLFPGPKINAFETKAGFALTDDYHGLDGDVGSEVEGIDPATVVNLTGSMDEHGRLRWDAPPGDWKILRLGYSLTGKTNSPATEEATGLEVDKYDAEAVERYLDTYLGMYREVVGDELMGERGLRALLTDSTEVGPSNWTPKILEQFERLRGYDATPWLPALTGEIVDSRARSDGFLYDFRRTLGELSASEHYGTVARVAHRNNLLVYGESLEGNRDVSTLGDDLEMRRFADIPMAAMWAFGQRPAPQYVADMRGAASVAHLYGKKYVATESLTSIMHPWSHAPADLQPMIDAEFVNGVNRPVIHTSVHQPVDDKVPGLSLHVFGQFFTRHETWAEMARPWIDYIARNSYLLQQGRNVADVAWFYGEEPPIGVLASTRGYPADVPTRYGYDFVPPHALLNELAVDEGDLVTQGGARYRLLFLGGSSRNYMTLPVLKRLAALVEEGATVVGRAPSGSPGRADDDNEYTELVTRLWSGEKTTTVGRGRVIDGDDVEAALAQLDVAPAFAVDGAEQAIQFVHRQISDGDIYYLVNSADAIDFEARFRVTGKVPEIWHADTGEAEPVSYRIDGDETLVPLAMAERQSFFVVFRQPATETSRSVPTTEHVSVGQISGPWNVHFQPGRGAPAKVALDPLHSLSEHEQPGIKYFSGVATYGNTFELPETGVAGQPLLLDLGTVGDVAEVWVNRQPAGIAWKAPYRLDIGELVVPGTNTLEIRVANLWVNRLIGDVQPEAEKIAYTTFKTYLPEAPLRPSGLMGPVRLLSLK